MTTALIVFSTALAASVLCTPLAGWLGRRLQLVDTPDGRHQHAGTISRLGGVGLVLALFAGCAMAWWLDAPAGGPDRLRIAGMLLGTLFVFGLGLLDDWRELGPIPQLLGQLAAAAIAMLSTVFIERFTNPLNGELVVLSGWLPLGPLLIVTLTSVWIAGMMNTVNWLDGLDGLAAGVGAIAALLFAAHMYSVGQPPVALFALALAGACIGFLPFNFSPARVFLGSAGVFTIGFQLAALSILAPARFATALLVLAVPITDTFWRILMRIRSGRSPLHGDRGHLHFRLLDRGYRQNRIVLGYWVLCAVLGLLSLLPVARIYKLGTLAAVLAGASIALARLSSPKQLTPAQPPQQRLE